MRGLLQGILIASSLLAPAFLAQAAPALAAGPSAAATTLNNSAVAALQGQQGTITWSKGSLSAATVAQAGEVSRVAQLFTPDLQVRVLDQSGPHDPTIYPPEGAQEVLAVGQTEELTLQVRNASGVNADNVGVELYLTGLLDPQTILSASNGLSCSLNTPDAHFILCTGGTLASGGWSAAASISLRAAAVQTGTAVLVATVNPGHVIAESNFDNDQDAHWVTVTAVSLH